MKFRIAVVVAASALLSLWWFWPRKVSLSDSEYDVAMALYRVCNQSSEEGLAKIEFLLSETDGADSLDIDSPLPGIIEQAKLGRWEDAARSCRRILDDQVLPTSSR